MRRLLRAPLVHFVLLGAAIFALFAFVSGRDEAPRDAIVVSAGKIAHLGVLFERTWGRAPTRSELQGVVDDFVREEVAYREAMAVGLDLDDTIIRRRLRQKLEFLAEDFGRQVEPSDAELAVYLAEHREDFQVEPRLAFRQVYLNPDTRGDTLEAKVRQLLGALNGDAGFDAAAAGDRILLQHGYADASQREVADLFGAQFAASLFELEPGEWYGAIESSYGVHLVRIDGRTDGRVPELAEVREAVRLEAGNLRRKQTIEAFYSEMLGRYEVRIEWPEPDA